MPAEALPTPHNPLPARLSAPGGVIRRTPLPARTTGVAYASIASVRQMLGPDLDAQVADDDVTAAIDQATAEINSTLNRRYLTPFSAPVPPIVSVITRDMAAYYVTLTARHGDPIQSGEPEQIRYSHSQQLLRGIQQSQIEIDSTLDRAVADPQVANLYERPMFPIGTDSGLYYWWKGVG